MVLSDFIATLLIFAAAVHSGSAPDVMSYVEREDFRDVQMNLLAPRSEVVMSKIECANGCYRSLYCASFFFHEDNQMCQLMDVVYSHGAGSTSLAGNRYYTPYCDSSQPTTGNVSLLSMYGVDGINKGCSSHNLPGDVSCASHGSFMSLVCKATSTCAEVLFCDNTAGDGEYWLYPAGLGGETRAKIYCHNMASDPQEYITLPNPNSGDYPKRERPYCSGAEKLSVPGNAWGSRTFSKVKVDLETMIVDRTDSTFATFTGTIHPYGEAHDCYTNHGSTNVCGPIGTFQIDTQGTGLVFNTSISWVKSGWMSWAIFSRSSDGRLVDLNCGGYCGECVPDSPLRLQLYSADEPDESSATVPPSCVYKLTRKFT